MAMLAMVAAMLALAAAQGEPVTAPANGLATSGQPDEVDHLIQKAVADARAGNNAKALAYLDPMAMAITDRVKKEQDLVFCAQSEAEAKGYLARATAASPNVQFMPSRMCEILFLRAYVLINLHRLPEALDQLRQLIALEPDYPHYLVEYGSALREARELDAALKVYRRAVEIAAPIKEYTLDQAAAWRGVGFVLTEQGDLNGAEEAYRKSLMLAPGHPIAVNEMAYIARLRKTGSKAPPQTVESSPNPADVPPLKN